MLPNCLIVHIYSWAVWRLAIIAVVHSSINLHWPRIVRLMKEFRRHLSVTVSSSSKHPPSSEGGSITDHGTWPWIPGIRGALLPHQCWYGQCLSVAKGTLVPQSLWGHIPADILLLGQPLSSLWAFEVFWQHRSPAVSPHGVPPKDVSLDCPELVYEVDQPWILLLKHISADMTLRRQIDDQKCFVEPYSEI